MTVSSHDKLGTLMRQLTDGLKPFVEKELETVYRHDWTGHVKAEWRDGALRWEAVTLFGTMIEQWNAVFSRSLRASDRNLVFQLRDHRNRWAHLEVFTTDEAYRAFDDAEQLLASVRSPLAATIKQQKLALLQTIHEEQQVRLREEQENEEREQQERAQRQHLLETLLPVYLSNPQGEIIQAILAILQREQGLNKIMEVEIADYFKRTLNSRSNKQEFGERQIQRVQPLKSLSVGMPTDSSIEAQGLQRVKEALEAANYHAELFQRNVLRVQSKATDKPIAPRLIRVISATEESFNIRKRYKDIENGLLVFVWYAHNPLQAVIYAMTYEEAFDIADRKKWTLTDSWQRGDYYSTTRPDRTLRDYLKPYLMTPEKWHHVLSGEMK